MKLSVITFFALSLISVASNAAEPAQCQQQLVETTIIEMCMHPGAAFQHDLYTMKADGVMIFALVDDYSEKVELEHTIPPGETLEFPLSKQGSNPIKITGGCVPESKNGHEVARLCNFHWGKTQVVNDVRFTFK
ncbi:MULTISPECIES: hypothetical protein [unclassified Herbaspirillum]|jgi:hypothetical protein|uniref:hypothetical protein n=1 Tax=unclassified Herbaspirillum TaxID=2624150 RepID=UPI000E2FA625|nr:MULTISPECIES: hypothetical protein [unclassified Herbaspirillum]RFB65819.1 hypothetical protein DZB54_23645 [Herbaspirillum sp. 3R-3a1]TFI08871.1 hypothetical protein E4P32_12135 [Herbaspirillum sp. 3R11]TFI15288.1 hypothetical protein E4P31_12135 [Herbaspirillum sp. 3R-11]TFI27833.1 hypothetical protein E4P30_09105 [Herbaspirillum sp. 3C11]